MHLVHFLKIFSESDFEMINFSSNCCKSAINDIFINLRTLGGDYERMRDHNHQTNSQAYSVIAITLS